MLSVAKFALINSFQLCLYVEIYFTLAVDDLSGDYYGVTTPKADISKKCGLWDYITRKCTGTNLKPQYTTTTPVSIFEKDKVLPASSFNFGAFIIALFVSLIVALSGAFACWCCRTFLSRRTSLLHLNNTSTTLPMDSLMDPSTRPTETRVQFMRSNSLPAYSAVASSNKTTTAEEPPPTYNSLFGATAEGNKS